MKRNQKRWSNCPLWFQSEPRVGDKQKSCHRRGCREARSREARAGMTGAWRASSFNRWHRIAFSYPCSPRTMRPLPNSIRARSPHPPRRPPVFSFDWPSCQKESARITTNLGHQDWAKFLNDDTLTAALLSRIKHSKIALARIEIRVYTGTAEPRRRYELSEMP